VISDGHDKCATRIRVSVRSYVACVRIGIITNHPHNQSRALEAIAWSSDCSVFFWEVNIQLAFYSYIRNPVPNLYHIQAVRSIP
jgi:hypothetical protein